MKVLGDAVLVKVVEQGERMVGKLYVPGSISGSVDYGEVVSVGRGVISAGQIIPVEVKPGDTVLFGSQQKIPVEVEGEDSDLFIIKENGILAIIDKPKTVVN